MRRTPCGTWPSGIARAKPCGWMCPACTPAAGQPSDPPGGTLFLRTAGWRAETGLVSAGPSRVCGKRRPHLASFVLRTALSCRIQPGSTCNSAQVTLRMGGCRRTFRPTCRLRGPCCRHGARHSQARMILCSVMTRAGSRRRVRPLGSRSAGAGRANCLTYASGPPARGVSTSTGTSAGRPSIRPPGRCSGFTRGEGRGPSLRGHTSEWNTTRRTRRARSRRMG